MDLSQEIKEEIEKSSLQIASQITETDIDMCAREILKGQAIKNHEEWQGQKEQHVFYHAMSISLQKLIKSDIQSENDAKIFKKISMKNLKSLNSYDIPYFIENHDKTFRRSLNSFDSILVSIHFEKFNDNPKNTMIVVCPYDNAIIDLLNMKVVYWDTKDIKGFESD